MPNRELREGIRTSPTISELTDPAFRLYVLLLTAADDFGRFHADPRLVNSACFPFGGTSPASVSKSLSQLGQKGIIKVYEIDGREYMEIQQWKQRKRCNNSKYPDPKGFRNMTDTCPTSASQYRPRSEERGARFEERGARSVQQLKRLDCFGVSILEGRGGPNL